MIKIHTTLLFLATIYCGACSSKSSQEEVSSSEKEEELAIKAPVEINSLSTEAVPDAMIELFRPLGNEKFSPGKVPFEFNIKNFPFGQKRPLMISFNGGDPQAFSQAVFSKEFNSGSYRLVAFLTDESGLALKEFGNFVDRDFLVGASRPFPAAAEPYIMVNYPRENQEYTLGMPVVVDFLVLGGDLKMDGLKVDVKVADMVYTTSEIDALQLTNLPAGEHVIRVALLKDDGGELATIFATANKRIVVK